MQYIRSEYSFSRWERELQKLKKRQIKKEKAVQLRPNKLQEAYQRREQLLLKKTDAEKSFAFLLRQHKLGYEEQQIYVLNDRNYRIFDFYVLKLDLAVEIDGSYHDSKQAKEYDIWKDKKTKLHVLRISNELALNHEVCNQLIEHLLVEKYKTFGKTLNEHDAWRF